MAFVLPEYSPDIVDAAGNTLLETTDPNELDDALLVIDNWRLAHRYPLNTFQMTLRKKARHVYHEAIVSQRLKRLSAIEDKLRRYPSLTLSEMQDLGGCRAVLFSVDQVYALAELYRSGRKRWMHELDDRDDYIRKPKSSGYRGIHLIYRHFTTQTAYNGLKIEIQLRSALQHVWATAVETVDIFLRQGFKASRGSPEWRRFFSLMGTAMALRENCRRVPRTPKTETELINEIRYLERKLDVLPKLETFGRALQVIEDPSVKRSRYVILVLNPRENSVTIYGYKTRKPEAARSQYLELERQKPEGGDVVLVSMEDVTNLQRAYPNYFLDTRLFRDIIRETIA